MSLWTRLDYRRYSTQLSHLSSLAGAFCDNGVALRSFIESTMHTSRFAFYGNAAAVAVEWNGTRRTGLDCWYPTRRTQELGSKGCDVQYPTESVERHHAETRCLSLRRGQGSCPRSHLQSLPGFRVWSISGCDKRSGQEGVVGWNTWRKSMLPTTPANLSR